MPRNTLNTARNTLEHQKFWSAVRPLTHRLHAFFTHRNSWNARKSQGDPPKSSEELGIFEGLRLSQFVSVWPLTTDHYFGVLGVFLSVSRVFQGIMGCSRGVPGLFRAVPGCSGGIPGFSGVFRGVPGVFRVLQTPRFSCLHFAQSGTLVPLSTNSEPVSIYVRNITLVLRK